MWLHLVSIKTGEFCFIKHFLFQLCVPQLQHVLGTKGPINWDQIQASCCSSSLADPLHMSHTHPGCSSTLGYSRAKGSCGSGSSFTEIEGLSSPGHHLLTPILPRVLWDWVWHGKLRQNRGHAAVTMTAGKLQHSKAVLSATAQLLPHVTLAKERPWACSSGRGRSGGGYGCREGCWGSRTGRSQAV